MKKLNELFKNGDKKNMNTIFMLFLIGIILIIAGSTLFQKQPKDNVFTSLEKKETKAETETTTDSYEKKLEKRLEDTLSAIDGVGDVKVMLTIGSGREIIVAEDVALDESITKESDVEGGTRETSKKTESNKKLIIPSKSGNSEPLIIKEVEPKIEGVIIVAKGGESVLIKDALIRATQTVLGVEPHKVQVLKMK